MADLVSVLITKKKALIDHIIISTKALAVLSLLLPHFDHPLILSFQFDFDHHHKIKPPLCNEVKRFLTDRLL